MAQSRQQSQGNAGSGGNPSAPQQTRGVPENAFFQRLYGFDGLNYNAGPAHIGDQELLWCDNLHPIAPGKLRAMFDVGSPIYTTINPRFIIGQPHFYTLAAKLYAALELDDGSLVQVLATTPFTVTSILPAGTLAVDSDFTQWGSQYLIIVSDITNGYWIWDGQTVFKSGTIGPIPTILSGGIGYTSAPTITTLGGSGSGATFTSTIQNGAVATIRPLGGGSGWLATDANPIALLFDNGSTIRSAHGHAVLDDGVISNAIIDDGGTGYTSIPTIAVTDGGGGPGAGADIVADGFTNGEITSIRIVVGGRNYGTLGTVALAFSGGGGSGATAHVVLSNGVITSVVMDDHGAGYGDLPDPTFVSATGTGAAGTAILKAKTVDSVNITIGGSGYTGNVYVVFNSTTGPALATVGLMPYGVNGISVATFAKRVWISHYPTPPLPPSILFTAVDDPSNFGPPGGAVPLTDEYLRYKLSHLIPSGSFLYLIADSSVGYITGVVETNATGNLSDAITTFSIVNVDPESGSPWRGSVYSFEQSVIMVNSFGIHFITGGSVKKVSTQIDDLFSSDTANIGVLLPSTGAGTLNGVHVFAVLWPITDPTTAARRRIILLSDGRRWWTYSPGVTVKEIATSEIDSELLLWCHDGFSLYKCFQAPSTNILKKLRTKLYLDPSMISLKRAQAAYIIVQPISDATFSLKPVNENGIGAAVTPGFGTLAATQNFSWSRTQTQAEGYVLGWELSTIGANITINELGFLVQDLTNRMP